MTTLSSTLTLNRAVLTEVVEDSNVTPRSVVAGTSSSVQGSSGSPKTDEQSRSGSFRSYGNGNTRLILGSGTTRTNAFALIAITEEDVETLQALLGHTVCYRNPDGVKVFGAFLNMQVVRLPGSGGLRNVAVTIQSVTYDEAV